VRRGGGLPLPAGGSTGPCLETGRHEGLRQGSATLGTRDTTGTWQHNHWHT
jgi:hypothetical protein